MFLCQYYIVISDTLVGSFLDKLFLLLAVVFSELSEKPYFLCHFLLLCLSSSFPFPVDVLAVLVAPIKIHNIALGGILCDYIE